MAGKQIGNTREFNSLQSGLLPIHESQNPSSQRYAHGMEYCEGAMFFRGRVSKFYQNGERVAHVFQADYSSYPDGRFYKRNTLSGTSGEESTFTTIPNDSIIGISESLNAKFRRLVGSGRILAKNKVTVTSLVVGVSYRIYSLGTTTTPGWNGVGVSGTPAVGSLFTATGTTTGTGMVVLADEYNPRSKGDYAGFADSTPFTTSDCKLIGSGDLLPVDSNFVFARAVQYDIGDGSRWGVLGKKTYKISKYKNVPGQSSVLVDTYEETDKKYTIVNGRFGKRFSDKSYTQLIAGVSYTWYMSISVEPVLYTIPSGTNLLNGTSDVYLVGTSFMFNPRGTKDSPVYAKDPRSYSYTTSLIDKRTVATNNLAETLETYFYGPEVPILRWASTTEDQGFSVDDNSTLQSIGVAGMFSYSNSPSSDVNATIFFSFVRNKFVGKRRVGIAEVKSTKNKGIPGDKCIGFSKLGDGSDRVIPGSTVAASPYAVFLSEAPVWVEVGYKGVFAGTAEGEYLISGEQDATGYSMQKISSIGASSITAPQDYCDTSTYINGMIFFITKNGIAHLQFSNETQSFVPKTVNLVEMGFGAPTSISSSRSLNCVIVSTNNDTQAVVSLETGAISMIQSFSTSDVSQSFQYLGTRTELGEPVFVFISQSSYYMSRLSDTQSGITLRTTKFMSGPERTPKINKVYLMLSESFGGRVRVHGSDTWESIPYTSEEISAGSFTGVKEVMVSDVADSHGTGKSIELEFRADEPLNLVGLFVGGDS